MSDNIQRIIIIAVFALVFSGCTETQQAVHSNEANEPKLFDAIKESQSNIRFRNDIDDLGDFTPYNTLYIYNGGGVAVGDINNDGLVDIVLTGNQVPAKLYLNLGNFQFIDITEKSGVFSNPPWVTGVTMADVNNDGWLDIYICRGGNIEHPDRRNLLFINNGDTTFTEMAAQYGLDDNGASTHAEFFDYDNDGDLDVYIANHPVNFKLALDFFNYINYEEDTISSDKLYENIGGSFIDVTKKAGLNRDNGFGLSITTFDVNGDGWLDIYIANDFLAPDFLYISQQDKTFKNEIKERFSKLSLFSMGSDASDINNDGQLDLLVVDMDPHGHYRKKKYDLALPMEYYKIQKRFFEIDQFSKNMLFINDNGIFKDIAHLSGLASTEWSWSALIDDFDNDGFNDIAISNGLKKDFHERDYSMLKFDGKDHYKSRYKHNATALVDSMPRSLVRNFLFKNMDGYNFEDRSMEWGMHEFNSQGVAIADFDNDGDLDMVFNNTDTFSVVYRNNAEKLNNNYLRIKCAGEINKFGIGTVVEIFYDGNKTQKKRMANARSETRQRI